MRKNWFQQLKEWLKYNWKYVIHQLLLLGILIVLIIIMLDSRKYSISDAKIPDCWPKIEWEKKK